MRALLYLEYRTVVNHAKLALRSPKRLIPVLFMLGWLLFIFVGPGGPRANTTDIALADLQPYMVYIWPAVFGLLVLVSSVLLTAAFSQSLIAFRQAEMDFLVPSGLDRRLILGSKLLRLMTKSLGLPIFITIIWMPSMRSALAYGENAAAWLAYLAFFVYAGFFLSLYTLVNLVGAYRPGGRWWASMVVRGLAYSVVLSPIVLALAGWLLAGNALALVLPALRNPVVTGLLFPVKWLTDLLLAPIGGWSIMRSFELLGLAILGGVTFALAVNRRENPYEPSLVSRVGVAGFLAASRTGDWSSYVQRVKEAEIRKINPARTSIPPFGRGAWALVWKSVVSLRRSYFSAYVGLLLLLGLLVSIPKIVMVAVGGVSGTIPSTMVALSTVPILVLFGSLFAMMELRKDLKQVNLVKPMPFPAWQMLAAETTHAVGFVTAAAWAVMLETAVLYGMPADGSLFLLAAVTPFVSAAAACVQLPVSVIYPDMDDPTAQSAGGFLTMVSTMAVLGLSGFIGVGLWGLGLWRPAVALAVVLFTSAISITGVAGATLLYARYDPTDE